MVNDIQAIAFDLDGTLIDAADWHYAALNNALAAFNFEPIRYNEHLESFNGLPTREKLALLASTGRFDMQWADGVSELKQEHTTKFILEKCRPDWKLKTTLDWILDNAYPMCVVTNCSEATASLMLDKAGLIKYFEFVIANEMMPFGMNKPHAAPYQVAARRLHLPTSSLLAIEDSDKGIKSAVAAGCPHGIVSGPSNLTISFIEELL